MRFLIVAAVAAAVAAGHAPSADGQKARGDKPAAGKAAPDKTSGSELMKKKLEHAKKLLEGLTTNNFDAITKSSEELMLISQKAEFAAQKTRAYELQTNDFRRALEAITAKAKEKSLDGATLGYVDMTLACVRCHQDYRETKIGKLPVPEAVRVAAGQ
jgi:cytochrome c556